MATDTVTPAAPTKERLWRRLYTGTGAFDIIGKRKISYIFTAVVVAISIVAMLVRGFSMSIDFEGGSRISFPSDGQVTISEAEEVFEDTLGFAPVTVQTAGSGGSESIQIQSQTLDFDESEALRDALFTAFTPEDETGGTTANAINISAVSSSWGEEITKKALIALVVFLVVVGIYIAIRFERDMAIAALAGVFLDLVVTAGLYALVGWEVSPATVIGLLTILGYSLYDTVVVFDKVEENTEGATHSRRRTYAEQVNLAVNQTLMRSINTSLTTILPIMALMVIAVWWLGVGTLKDLSLVLLIGIIIGTYSSIYTSSTLLVDLKLRRPEIQKHDKKVYDRRAEAAEKAEKSGASDDEIAIAAAGGPEHAGGGSGRFAAPKPGARPQGRPRKRKKR